MIIIIKRKAIMSHPTLQSRGNADTAVVLLTGADRLSLDSVAFSLADSYASVCAISYDVRPNGEADAGLSIVRRVSRPVGQGVGWATRKSSICRIVV